MTPALPRPPWPSPAPAPHRRHPWPLGLGLALLALAGPLLWAEQAGALSPHGALAAWLPWWRGGADLIGVVIAALVFITGYNAALSPRKGAVVLLGVAFLGVGLLAFLDVVHRGALIGEAGPGLPWFGLLSRLAAACALLIYAALPPIDEVSVARKRLGILVVLGLVVAFACVFEWRGQWLPALLDDASRARALLNGLQYSVVTLHLATLLVLWLRRELLRQECLAALNFAALFSAVAGLFGVLALARTSAADSAGAQLYLIAAGLYIFHATYTEALERPLERLRMLYQCERATLSAAPDGVLWVDRRGVIVLANPAMETLSGYTPQELLGQNVAIFLPPHLREKHAGSMAGFFLAPNPRAMGMMDLQLCRKDGGLKPVDISLGYYEMAGQPHAIAYLRDLSERKQLEESLRHQATHDSLTRLPNRWLFQLQLKQALLRIERNRLSVAILFMDLDNFKSINDTFGHAVGDALLIQVSSRVQDALRASDLVARMGGDEFAILLPDIAHADEAIAVAAKILASLQQPFELPGQHIHTSGSIGIAYYPADATDSETLLRYADMAMYRAKQNGRGTYACYSEDLDRRTHEDMLLHARLKTALSERLLTLHFQPQIRLDDGRLVGAEALLRWNDPVLGPIAPDRFIPLAEKTGLILPLADWVLETACRQIAAWQAAGTPIRLAVNISAHQLQHGLAEKIHALLASTGARAHWLELEITESAAMDHPAAAHKQLSALVALGCSVSLDDFGTGYSSLAYLKTLPIDSIKIDKSFIHSITDDPNDDIIVQTIIGMAHNLGLTVIAEGVETPAQRERLARYGCNICQGYLFHRPMPLEAFEQLLERHAACAGLACGA